MFDQFQNERDSKERKTIQASRILAQAKAPARKGGVVIVVVYEMSSQHNYFFKYSAKTSRSPRRTWKLIGWNSIHDGRKFGETKASLDNFLSYCSFDAQPGVEWKVRYPHKKINFLNQLDRISNPMKYTTPSAPAGSTFGYASAKTSGRRPTKQDYAAYNNAVIRYDNIGKDGS